jgi:Concanavalin A-like lectin/glucanases superfamily
MRHVRRRNAWSLVLLAPACCFLADLFSCAPFQNDAAIDQGPASDSGVDEATGPDAAGPEDAASAEDARSTAIDCTMLRTDPRTLLCDSFDDRADPLIGWSELVKVGTGTLALEAGVLRATTTPDAGSSRAALRKMLPRVDKHITLAASIRFASLPTTDVQVLAISTASTEPSYYVLMVSSGGLKVREQSFADGGQTFVYTPSGNVVADQWTRVEIGVDFTTSPSTLKVIINGTSALEQASQVSFLPGLDPAVAAGIWFALPTPEFDLRVDDVVVTGD